MSQYESLFTPFSIGNCEIKNRFVLEPMEGTNIIDWLQETKFRGNEVHDYYIERAKNNIGLIIPGMIPLRSLLQAKWLPDHPEVFKDVKPLMDEIHSYGAKVFFQIGAGWGRALTANDMFQKINGNRIVKEICKPILNMDKLLISASENSNRWIDTLKHRELTKEEIQEFVQGYAIVAKYCKDAGVDGVEVHAVHEGYLMDEFTTRYTNHRLDEYGGSFENRYRFAKEVVEAIKEKCGKDYPVSIRFSVCSKTKGFQKGAVPQDHTYIEVGRDLEEGIKAAQYLEQAGYDMLNADNGTYDAWYWSHPPVYMPLNCNLNEAMEIKPYVNIPVVCAGRMQPDAADFAISEGKLDGIGIGRQFLTDPETVTKILENREEDILPCISCHNVCLPVALNPKKGVALDGESASTQGHCALNPVTFAEKKYQLKKTEQPEDIAIVGGGIGGMCAAILLKKRGHNPIIYEKTSQLGGVFIAASAPSFKEKDKQLLKWYIRQIKELNIEVHLETEIEQITNLKEEKVIICTGAKPRNLHIENSIEAIDYLKGTEVGNHVLVIGGGLTGCEIAYDLALKGKKPVILELQDDILKVKNLCMANSTCLKDLLDYYHVPVYVQSSFVSWDGKRATISTPDSDKIILCDSIITSCGYISDPLNITKDQKRKYDRYTKRMKNRSKNKLPEPAYISMENKKVYLLGDCNQVGNLKTVIWSAYDLAYKL